MNLNDLGFLQKQRNKRKALKVQCLQNGKIPAAEGKRKSSTTASEEVRTNERWSTTSGHNTSGTSKAVSSSVDDQGIIIAISEGRGEATCEVGISAMNIQHPELALYQISDTSSYLKVLSKINLLNPVEILLPATMANSRLLNALKGRFPDVKILAVDRSTFRKNEGLQYIQEICALEYNSVLLMLQHKYYALTATGALKTFLETYKRQYYAKESIKVTYNESDYNTMIDVFIADKLELVSCALGDSYSAFDKRYSSLRGVINHCVTKLGARMLRSNILQPPNQQKEIEERLDCVEELVKTPERLASLRDILKKLSHFGQVLALGSVLKTNVQYYDERHMNYVLQLNIFFDEIEPLKELLASCNAPFFHELGALLDAAQFKTLHSMFKLMIHEDARPAVGSLANAARCFAIKGGQNEILDILRKKYSDRLDEMKEHVSEMSRQLGYDFKLASNAKKGYHMALSLAQKQRHTFNKHKLPPDVCQVDVMCTMVTMKTIKLITLSNRLDDTSTEILRISNVIIHKLLLEVQSRISRFYDICEKIAKLDVLQSLAQASSAGNKYVRPKFNTYTEVIDARHPLLDYLLEHEPVANNIIANPINKLHIITGPNGSGKSIYIRQIVLLQIMAQLGCFVPATKATFKICDMILARIYFEDNIECGASAFTLEMKEIQYFLNVVTDRTLIIIDELCRSTAVREGAALAMAICESLLKTPAFVFFTTHYTYITNLQQIHKNVKCWQLETKQIHSANSVPRLTYTHRVIPGVVTLEEYGFALACSVWPKVIIDDIKTIMPKVTRKMTNTSVDPRVALKINLESELQEMKRLNKCTKYGVYLKCLEYQKNLAKLGIQISFHSKQNSEIQHETSQRSITENRRESVNSNSNSSGINNNEEINVEYLYPEVVYSNLEEEEINVVENENSGSFNEERSSESKISQNTEQSKNTDSSEKSLENLDVVENNNVSAYLETNHINSEVMGVQSKSLRIDRNPTSENYPIQENNELCQDNSTSPELTDSSYNLQQKLRKKHITFNKTNSLVINTTNEEFNPSRRSFEREIADKNDNIFLDATQILEFIPNKAKEPQMNQPAKSVDFFAEINENHNDLFAEANKTKGHRRNNSFISKSFNAFHDNDKENDNDIIFSCPTSSRTSSRKSLAKKKETNKPVVDFFAQENVEDIFGNSLQHNESSNTSLTSGKFILGIQRENTSTPLDKKPFYATKTASIRSNTNEPKWACSTIFNRDVDEALEDLNQIGDFNFPESSLDKMPTNLSTSGTDGLKTNLSKNVCTNLSTSGTEGLKTNLSKNVCTNLSTSGTEGLKTNLSKNVLTNLSTSGTEGGLKTNLSKNVFRNTSTSGTEGLKTNLSKNVFTNLSTSGTEGGLKTNLSKNVLSTYTETTTTGRKKSHPTSETTSNGFVAKRRKLMSSFEQQSSVQPATTTTSKPTTSENNNFDTSVQSLAQMVDQVDINSTEEPEPKIKRFKSVTIKPMNKLTKKEIEGMYEKKRMNLLQCKNAADVEAYYNELMNRPSVKQIRASEVIMSARKTSNGQYVIDVPTNKSHHEPGTSHGKKTRKYNRFQPPLKNEDTFGRNFSFPKQIFSDANSELFEQFIQTKDQHYHDLVKQIKTNSTSTSS